MTLKELKNVLMNCKHDEGAQVYIEVSMGDNTYLQRPIERVRFEQNSHFSCFIIEEKTGGEVD